ncbi:aldose 1-epimerase family protein [Castellaniella sp.]|uniref:aldose 1-epimerase family protein n=1 Tax=Castellaniella sp. TaxID=1955812 RepID=UPI002AFEBD1C|nr:aldose 1-epimerase family protein [Castellaniella sp.]
MSQATFSLRPQDFTPLPHELLASGSICATAFRYPSGVEGLRLQNARGYLEVLPYMGQMIWRAEFDGVKLTMGNRFDMPRPATSIVQTYGCLAFHSGLLSNGCPSPQDTHPLHGEMPCAPMDRVSLVLGEDAEGAFIEVQGEYEYIMGFGAHYLARPSVRLHAADTRFQIKMDVQNLSAAPMDLMYMCHVNFAYRPGARVVQPAPFTADHVQVRQTVPGHVRPTPDYLALIDALAADPSRMEVLDEPERYDPEQVFYVRDLAADAQGHTHLMLQLAEGDGFAMSYPVGDFPKTVRWVLVSGDAQVAAFALPSTCEPEGYLAEKAKGNVRVLQAGERAAFAVRVGYLAAAEAADFARMIQTL